MPQNRIDDIRKVNGCFKKLNSKTLFHKYKSLSFSRCVCNYFDSKINILLELNEYYKVHKRLPSYYMYKVETLPSKAISAINLVNSFLEDKKIEELKAQQQEAIKKGKNGR